MKYGEITKTIPSSKVIPPNDDIFIKMCAKAEEIQTEHGDVWITFGRGILYSYGNIYYKCLTEDRNRWHLIWLPTQAQLQAMMGYRYPMSAGGNLGRWLERLSHEEYEKMHEWSMESLWLAFVMQEKYGKVWGGEEWIVT